MQAKFWRYAIAVILLAVILSWVFWPNIIVSSLIITDENNPQSVEDACEKIAKAGPGCVPVIIGKIKSNSPWEGNDTILPVVLNRISKGDNAYKKRIKEMLCAEIDKEPDDFKRAFLVSALQRAYGDFSRLDKVISDAEAGELSDWVLINIADDVKRYSSLAPDFAEDTPQGMIINPDFVK